MKKSFQIFLIIASALSLSCNRSLDSVTVIRFWAMGNEGEMVMQMIPEFEKKNPNIRVVAQQIPWTAAHEKMLTAFAGGSLPDVFQMGNTWIPEFTVLNSLEPLESLVKTSLIVQLPDYFEGVLKTNIIDSVLYGIPWYVDTRVIYYRKDLLREAGFKELPKTWDEVIKVCDVIQRQAKEKGITRYPFFLPTGEWVPVIALGMQTGGHFLKDNMTRGNFSGPEFRKAYELLGKFYEKKYSPSGMQLITNLYNSFSDGLIAMYITGPWNIGEFSRRISPEIQNEWMTAPLPSMDSTYPGNSLPLGTSLVISRTSRNKEAAWKFIEFLSSREQTISFYKITGNLPPRKSAWTDSSLANNKYIQAFHTQLERVEPLPQVAEWEQIVIRLQIYVEYIATQTMTVDEALKKFDAEVDQMLEKRRWLVEQKIKQ
ncbi:MAG: sugar ABC transporter substrate-binding protein [Bacteroidota bacterium]|nr:sugar ABC transporter substrate-binding protein [Bacteroidota bacterium]